MVYAVNRTLNKQRRVEINLSKARRDLGAAFSPSMGIFEFKAICLRTKTTEREGETALLGCPKDGNGWYDTYREIAGGRSLSDAVSSWSCFTQGTSRPVRMVGF